MRTAYLKQFFDDRRARLQRRGSGFLLALAVELLIVLGLLFLWPAHIPKFGVNNGDRTFQMFDVRENQHNAKKQAQQQQQRQRVTPPKVKPPSEQMVPPTPPPVLVNIPGMITISRDDYQKTDIAKLPKRPGAAQQPGDAELAENGGAGDDSQPIGKAPNGEPLYAAEWYREPTEQELGFYLPKNLPPGASGMIVCKTAARHTVVDCVQLGDNVPGAGMARGIVNASWQFQVRAPRKGGQEMMGAWVRIRIDMVEGAPHARR